MLRILRESMCLDLTHSLGDVSDPIAAKSAFTVLVSRAHRAAFDKVLNIEYCVFCKEAPPHPESKEQTEHTRDASKWEME